MGVDVIDLDRAMRFRHAQCRLDAASQPLPVWLEDIGAIVGRAVSDRLGIDASPAGFGLL